MTRTPQPLHTYVTRDRLTRNIVNNRVICARYVQVVEESTKLICLEKIDDQKERDLGSEINDNDVDEIKLINYLLFRLSSQIEIIKQIMIVLETTK